MSTELKPKHEAVLRKAAAAIRARGHEGDARLADSVDGIVASLSRRASPAAAVPEDALTFATFEDWLASDVRPPTPGLTLQQQIIEYACLAFNAGRARAAVEADRARQQDMSVRLAGAPAGQHDACDAVLAGWKIERHENATITAAHPEQGAFLVRYNDQSARIGAMWNLLDAVLREKSEASRCRAQGGDGATLKQTKQLLENFDELADRAQQGEPVYQVQHVSEQGSSAWHDATEEAYHTFMPERRRIVYHAATKAAAPADASLFADEATRLRRVVNLLDLHHAVPGNDASLRECLFSVLGLIARELERRATPVPDTGTPTAGAVEGWISVEDDLPEPVERVLVTRFAGRVGNAEHPGHPGVPWVEVTRYMVNCSMFECDLLSTGNVTHWKRIAAAPQPPEAKACTYPKCNCPFDAPSDPDWCARGLARPPEAKAGEAGHE